MATEKPRFTITMEESLLDAVDDFKFENRIKNQSKAIVELVKLGLEELKRTEQIKPNSILLNQAKPPSAVAFGGDGGQIPQNELIGAGQTSEAKKKARQAKKQEIIRDLSERYYEDRDLEAIGQLVKSLGKIFD